MESSGKLEFEIVMDLSRDSLFDELGIRRLKESYMLESEISPQERFAHVSKVFSSNKEHAQRLYDYSSKHWLSYSTPILSFGRSKRGLPISCFLNFMEDTSSGLVDTLSETNWLSMLGGGVGIHLGIRAADSKSTGIMPHLKIYDAACLAYRQGKTRRGSYAAYLDISHPDIIQFLEMRKPTGDQNMRCLNLHHGINITNDFMKIIENCMVDPSADDSWNLKDVHTGETRETVSAKMLWQRILEMRMQTGEPYLCFVDTANDKLPEWLKKEGLKINGSNLCVTGDQLVVTSKGLRKVIDLVNSGEDLILFDGKKPVNASPMKLIEKNVPVYRIVTKSGRTHDVTSYHKIKTIKGMIACQDLKIGDKIFVQRNEGMFGNTHRPEMAFLLGLYHADGTQTDDKIFIDIWENDFNLRSEIEECIKNIYIQQNWTEYNTKNQFGDNSGLRKAKIPTFMEQNTSYSRVKKIRLQSAKLKQFGFKKSEIPDWILEGDKETISQYLRGLYIADGTVNVGKSRGNPLCLSLASIDKDFLKKIQIILSNLGIESKIYLLRKAGKTLLPDGKGGNKFYDTKCCWRLNINNKNDAIKFEKLTGFLSYKSFFLEERQYRNNTKKYDEIMSIDYLNNQDVYCTTVDSYDHVWVCNSFITSNCTEIFLPTNEERTAVCCLSSLNLEYFDDWKDDPNFIGDVAEMLDNVLEHFIQNAPDEISRAKFSAIRERSIGVGALGFHAYLQKNNVPFESVVAKSMNVKMFKHIKTSLDRANENLATQRGSCPDAEKHGFKLRFSHTTAIAPNASSSLIMGNTSPSVEPYRANVFRQDTISGASVYKNRFLNKILEEKCKEFKKDLSEVWSSIIANDGSVQHLDFLDELTKAVYKTAVEIDQRWVVDLAADRQEFIDQGQSINLFFNPDVNIKYLHAVHFMAWKMGLKSLYYCRSDKLRKADRVSQSVERKKIEEEIDLKEIVDGNTCIACEG